MHIYTDGACSGNQYKENLGSCAYVILDANAPESEIATEGKRIEFRAVQRNTTNNRMELFAVVFALQKVIEIGETHKDIKIFSDSNLLVKTFNEWIHGWKRRGWKKSDGNSPENLDLIAAIDEQLKSFDNVKFIHVAGHTDNPKKGKKLVFWNVFVDKRCNQALDNFDNEFNIGG